MTFRLIAIGVSSASLDYCRLLQDAPRKRGRFTWWDQAHLLVFTLCTWTWSPALIGWTTFPMSQPDLMTVSPTLKARRAILWPSGTFMFALARTVSLVS